MGDMTKNLSAHEFACRCKYADCPFKLVGDGILAIIIQGAVDHFATKYDTRAKVDITGPSRCPKHNADEGGAPNSSHQEAIAADHKIFVWVNKAWVQIPALEQYDYYDESFPTTLGLGLYHNRCHVDRRKIKARWGT